MLAQGLLIRDIDASLPDTIRPLLEAARQLEMNDDTYSWRGWSRLSINAFLKRLPAHCTLVVGVWETDDVREHEVLILGCVCEVANGEVSSIRTFEAFTGGDLPAVEQLEPGVEHAFKIMNVVRMQVAPVAWALFTDKTTWEQWLFATGNDSGTLDKGELLASLVRQGRCVLMGSQVPHRHS